MGWINRVRLDQHKIHLFQLRTNVGATRRRRQTESRHPEADNVPIHTSKGLKQVRQRKTTPAHSAAKFYELGDSEVWRYRATRAWLAALGEINSRYITTYFTIVEISTTKVWYSL